MPRLMYVIVAAVLLAPAVADAQSSKNSKSKRAPVRNVRIVVDRDDDDCCWGNRFTFEPYAGAFNDAYDISPDNESTGFLFGARFGYLLSSRVRLVVNAGYSNIDDVSNPNGLTSYNVYDNMWILTTGGAEFDVVPGNTAVALGLQLGAGWRKLDLEGSVGPVPQPSEEDDGFTAFEVIIPALSLRQRLSPRTTFSIGVHDHIFDFFEGPAEHSLAITAGISFR